MIYPPNTQPATQSLLPYLAILPTDPPEKMDAHEKTKMRAAAFRATRLFPGPVGELLSRELLSWEETGMRLSKTRNISALVNYILNTPLAGSEVPSRLSKDYPH